MVDAVPGHDYPERQTVVDVEVADHSGSVMSWVRRSSPEQLFLLVASDTEQQPQLLPGDVLTVVWRGPEELRALPLELTGHRAVGEELLWEVRPTGRAVRAQRRDAVRAPLAVRLTVDTAAGVQLTGSTVDLSEGGLRCGLHVRAGERPEPGSVVTATIRLDDGDPIRTDAEVVRSLPSGEGRAELSLRFIGLPERHEDRIRKLVFTQLRELQRRGLL